MDKMIFIYSGDQAPVIYVIMNMEYFFGVHPGFHDFSTNYIILHWKHSSIHNSTVIWFRVSATGPREGRGFHKLQPQRRQQRLIMLYFGIKYMYILFTMKDRLIAYGNKYSKWSHPIWHWLPLDGNGGNEQKTRQYATDVRDTVLTPSCWVKLCDHSLQSTLNKQFGQASHDNCARRQNIPEEMYSEV